MKPITRDEIYMAAAAGKYNGELPKPVARSDFFWLQIIERINANAAVNPEDIDAAIEDYLNNHDADIVTEQELFDKLNDKANAGHSHTGVYAPVSHTHLQSEVTGLENTLAGKADATHNHDDRYYTETETDTLLGGKSDTEHLHDDRYYTETEIDNKLGEKSNTGHTHDDRYYSEAEVDQLLGGKANAADIPDVSAFITRLVNDLINYYTKSETYTKVEIDSKVSAIPKFAIKPVNSLPTQDISDTTVYLLRTQNGEQGNMYDEYIYAENAWEKLGTQTIDLSGYYTAAEVDALLNGLSVAGHTHDDRYYTEAEIDEKVQGINTAIARKADTGHDHDDRYYTETEIDNRLGEKSNTGHSHATSDVTGLDAVLAGKSAISHTHALADITGLAEALAGKASTAVAVASVNGSGGSDGLMSAADKEKLDKINIAILTQAEYDILDPPDADTLYLIPEASNT